MKSKDKKINQQTVPTDSARMMERIYGCKWSLTVYKMLREGINRPGEMVRAVEGLTTKVLNDCLRKNVDFGILEKNIYPETPPRVEYSVTPLGEKFVAILDQLEELQHEIEKKAPPVKDEACRVLEGLV